MDIQQFNEIVQSLIRPLKFHEETEEYLEYAVRDNSLQADKKELLELLASLGDYKSEGETEIYNDNYYEILIRFNHRMFSPRHREALCKEDEVNGIKYDISLASDKYLIQLLDKLQSLDLMNTFRRRAFVPSSILRRSHEDAEGKFFEFLKRVLRIETIKITSKSAQSRAGFEKLSYAYIFNLGLNLDIPICPIRYLDEYASHARIRMRRAHPEEVEAPKRTYVNDLVLYYQRAIVSESLDNEFLSYYHIFEHFFENVYNEDLIDSIKKELSKGTFSYKRKKDVLKLVNLIKKKLKYKNDEFLIQEDEALVLTLKKFIKDFDELKQEISEYDEGLIDFFKKNEVVFSKGNRVNFEVQNKEEILKNLAGRIYKTRNAIVHSKETEKEKNKYLPFRDDKHLAKENILMRLLAERVIFESSSEI